MMNVQDNTVLQAYYIFTLKKLGFSLKEIVDLLQVCFDNAALRPGVKQLFQKLHKLKKNKKIKAIVMYTNASDGVDKYVSEFLKKSLEKNTNTRGLFDLVLTYEDSRKDPEIRNSGYNNGDIRKKLELVKKELFKRKNIKSDVSEMIMVDDKVRTILDYHKSNLKLTHKKLDIRVLSNGISKPILINVPRYERTITKQTIQIIFNNILKKHNIVNIKKIEQDILNSYTSYNDHKKIKHNSIEMDGKNYQTCF